MAAGAHRVVVLGGGFGGAYAAARLEKLRRGGAPLDVTLVNRENYLVFQPMLAEVVSGSVGVVDTVTPLRRMLPGVRVFVREVDSVDVAAGTVTLGPGILPRATVLEFDSLVVALGTVTDFRGQPGLPEHALPFKTLADAVSLRNHLIHVMEQAAVEGDADLRREMLTFVVAGGGFSGTEVVAEIADFVRGAIRKVYRSLDAAEVRVVLVHSGERVLERELTPRLSEYATRTLATRGVEMMLGRRLAAATPAAAVLDGGERIPTRTLVSTVPSSPNPVVGRLGLPTERGRLRCDATLQVEGTGNVWALGDNALVPMPGGGAAPPTAQHAIRQAKVAAANVAARATGGERVPFTFTGLGKMGALGHHRAVAELPGGVRLSGFLAWIMWRAVYWAKLPGGVRKTRVALSWMSDLVLPPDPLQLNLGGGRGVGQAHYEPGEEVFHQGDLGDLLYMVAAGEAEVVRHDGDGGEVVLARVGPGEYFGEAALLGRAGRNATVRAVTALDVLTLPSGDFQALVGSLPELRRQFEDVAARRAAQNAERLDR